MWCLKIVNYRLIEKFSDGKVVTHPKYGRGIVSSNYQREGPINIVINFYEGNQKTTITLNSVEEIEEIYKEIEFVYGDNNGSIRKINGIGAYSSEKSRYSSK